MKTANPSTSPSASRGGFTVIEVIVATIVLASGLLGLAGATAHVVRQVTLADLMTDRAYALQTVVEQVQATSFPNVGSGSDTVGVYAMEWSSTQESTSSKIVTVVTTGPGLSSGSAGVAPQLASQVTDTFSFRVINR